MLARSSIDDIISILNKETNMKAVLNKEQTKISLDGNVYDIYDRNGNFKVAICGVTTEKEAVDSCALYGIYDVNG